MQIGTFIVLLLIDNFMAQGISKYTICVIISDGYDYTIKTFPRETICRLEDLNCSSRYGFSFSSMQKSALEEIFGSEPARMAAISAPSYQAVYLGTFKRTELLAKTYVAKRFGEKRLRLTSLHMCFPLSRQNHTCLPAVYKQVRLYLEVLHIQENLNEHA